MSKTKKIVAILIVTFLLIVLGVQTKATNDNPFSINDIIIGGGENQNQITANQIEANQIAANAIVANQIEANRIAANSVIQPTVNKVSGTTNNELPQTGVTEDITVMFFIIVCVISALYAYRKIRNYNV